MSHWDFRSSGPRRFTGPPSTWPARGKRIHARCDPPSHWPFNWPGAVLNPRGIKDLVRQHNLGISPRRMGQNFLVDPKALSRIVSVIGAAPGDRVIEIGPGLGALTEELVATGATVTAIEKDWGFMKVLEDRFKEIQNLTLIHSDILKTDLATYAGGAPKSLLVVGNVPFSMTSPILEFLLKHRQWVKRAVLTIQKEVAQRIVAQPGTKVYSSITLLVQAAFVPSIAFTISPGSFYPQPKVTSAVVRLDPVPESVIPPAEEEAVLKLVRQLFTHRRKTLLNALALRGVGVEKEQLLHRLASAGINPTWRPEAFTLQEMAKLHRLIKSL